MGKERPKHIPHGSEEDITKKLQPMKVNSWRQEGNKLIAKSDAGEFVNLLPTDVMLVGVDENNQPKLQKIKHM